MFFAIFARYFRLYIQSVTTGASIGIFDLLGMTFRKVNPTVIVRSKIMAVQAGLGESTGITSKALEAHYLAGGNVPLVIRAIIAANKAKTIDLDFKLATAIDLAGRNVLEAVQTSVYPKVIDCPPRGAAPANARRRGQERHSIEGESPRDGSGQLEPTDRRRTEETIIARVGEGIVSAIGSAETHLEVLANRTESRRRCWPDGWTRKPPLKSCRSTSRISTWAITSAPVCRPIRPRPICASPARVPKDVGRWRWRKSRK